MTHSLRTGNHRSSRRKAALAGAALLTVGGFGLPLLSPSIARAADAHWNVANGDWNTAGNWNPAAVPTTTDFAIVDNATSGSTAHVTTTVPQPLGVFVQNGNVLSIESGGILTVNNPSNDPTTGIRIGDGYLATLNGIGSAVVTGTGQLKTAINPSPNFGGDAHVGVDGGTGVLTQNSAGSTINVRDLYIGETDSDGGGPATGAGTGTFNVSAGTTTLRGWARIGQGAGALGTFNLSGGAINNTDGNLIGLGGGTGAVNQTGGNYTGGWLGVGKDAGSKGNYNLSNGSLGLDAGADGDFNVGVDGGTGTFTQTGGTVHASRWGFVGTGGGGTGVYNQSAGTVSTDGWTRVGNNGGNGTYNLSGTAVLNVGGGDADIGDDDTFIGADPNSVGVVNVSNSASLNATRALRLGQAGGTGIINQTGGTVTVSAWIGIGDTQSGGNVPGTGTYNISGGNLNVTSVTGDINVADNANTTGTLSLSGTGAVSVNALFVGKGANSTGTVNQAGGTMTLGAGGLTIKSVATANGVYNLSGGTLSTATLVNNGTFNYTGGTANVGVIDGTGATIVGTAGSLNVTHVLQDSLTINGTGTVRVIANGGLTGITRLNTLALGANAVLDLNDNDLVVNGGNFATLQALVLGGYRPSPDSTATGIISTTSQTVHAGSTILALFDNSLIGFADFPEGSGNTIAANAVAGKYTYIGDTNYDGQVSAQDYTAIDANIGTSQPLGVAWFYGDTNFDGNIDATDYTGIDAALGLGAGNPLAAQGLAAVPEPGALGALGALAGSRLWLRRRRRDISGA